MTAQPAGLSAAPMEGPSHKQGWEIQAEINPARPSWPDYY